MVISISFHRHSSENLDSLCYLLKMGKGKFWTVKESEFLVKAWLDASQDSVTGTGQRASEFWGKILTSYDVLREDDPQSTENRNWTGLKQRFQLMQHDMKKFHGLYESLKRNIKSGYNEQQYRDLALSKWPALQDSKGKAFQFETCWLLVKDSPRWKASSDLSEKGGNAPETIVSGAVSFSGAESSRTPSKPVRPAGNKAAKAKRKSSAVDNSSGFDQLAAKQVKTSELFAQAALRRAHVMEDQFAMNLFMMNPDSEESKTFFAKKRQQYLKSTTSIVLQNPESPIAELPSSPTHSNEDILDDIAGPLTPSETSLPLSPTNLLDFYDTQ